MTCLFCKIANNEISAKIIYRDDKMLAFDDINPQSPIHKIIIPIQHIATINETKPEDAQLLGAMIIQAAQLARELNIEQSGYRLVMNCNEHGGQSVFHIHLHLLGGRRMHWPPG